MIRCAGQHAGFARAADALEARGWHRDAVVLQALEDGSTWLHNELSTAACQTHREATFRRWRFATPEMLEMDSVRFDPAAGVLECVNHLRGPAAVEVAACWGVRDDPDQVQSTGERIVGEAQMHVASHRMASKLFKEGGSRATASTVVQFPRGADLHEPLCHAPYRRDANPASDEHRVLRCLNERKMILWLADLKDCSDTGGFMHPLRTAAPLLLPFDPEKIPMPLARMIRERIAAYHADLHVHIDMGAGREGRQRRPMERPQVKKIHIRRTVRDRVDSHREDFGNRHVKLSLARSQTDAPA